MSRPTRTTHVLVPAPWADALRRLSKRTRVCQSEYEREAVERLRRKAREGRLGAGVPPPSPARLVSLTPRLTPEQMEALQALAASTRIRQSELYREGLADTLTAHSAL
jgi:hypothetical protein